MWDSPESPRAEELEGGLSGQPPVKSRYRMMYKWDPGVGPAPCPKESGRRPEETGSKIERMSVSYLQR